MKYVLHVSLPQAYCMIDFSCWESQVLSKKVKADAVLPDIFLWEEVGNRSFWSRKSEESALQLQLALDGRHAPSCALQLRAKMINKSKQNTAREVFFFDKTMLGFGAVRCFLELLLISWNS